MGESHNELIESVIRLRGALRETPVVQLRHPAVDLFVKLEYCNVAGSLKDRPAYRILRAAIERRQVDQETVIVESSSGNFALALAMFCKMLRLRFIPVIDPNILPPVEARLRALCERVVKVTEPDEAGGFLRTRLATVKALCASLPRSYWPNQYGNPEGMRAHYELTGREICEAVPQLDHVFIGVSSGGTISGVSRRVKERCPGAKVIAVDAEGSVIFGGEPRRRRIPGIGASIVPPLLREARIDDVVAVGEVETVAACHALLHDHHLFLGGSSRSCYAAVQQYFSGAPTRARPKVLFLAADRGVAYSGTIFSEEWIRGLSEVSACNSL